MTADEQSELHLQDLLKVVLRHRTLAAVVAVVVLASVVLVTFTATPVYRAACDILISRTSPGGIDSLAGEAYNYRAAVEFYPTQYEIIRSGAVARQVIEQLALIENPEFNPLLRERSLGFRETFRGFVRKFLGRDAKSGKTREDQTAQVKDAIRARLVAGLTVESVKNSQVTRISYDSSNPEIAAAIANATARAYIDTILDMKMGSSREAVRWLTQKLEEQRKKLDKSEKGLQEYTRRYDIVSIENREQITSRRMQEINVQLVDAETRTRELEALANQINSSIPTPGSAEMIPVVANDSIIQALREDEIELGKKIDELAQKYGPKHPQMLRARADLESLRERKMREIRRVAASVEKDLEFARAKEESVRGLLREAKAEGLELSERYIEYNVLQRDVLSNQQIYDALLKRFNATSLTEDIETSNVTILEEAKVPRAPIKPNKAKSLVLAFMLAVCAGIGSAFLVDYLDNTVKNPGHVETRLNLPFLGLVPLHRTTAKGVVPVVDRIATAHPKSTLAEAYRSIRTALMLSTPSESGHKVILVTSCVAQDGKTSSAVNLAEVFAQSGKRVLLVDADMRKARVHAVYKIRNNVGLSSVLAGIEKEVPIHRSTEPNLSLLPSGPVPPNPSELLTSSRAKKLFEVLREKYDIIIVDSPPAAVVTDALILSSLVDATVIVFRAGSTTFDVASRTIKSLRFANAHIVGAMLNAVDLTKDTYSKYYYYAYEQGYYGETEEKQRSGKDKTAAGNAG